MVAPVIQRDYCSILAEIWGKSYHSDFDALNSFIRTSELNVLNKVEAILFNTYANNVDFDDWVRYLADIDISSVKREDTVLIAILVEGFHAYHRHDYQQSTILLNSAVAKCEALCFSWLILSKCYLGWLRTIVTEDGDNGSLSVRTHLQKQAIYCSRKLFIKCPNTKESEAILFEAYTTTGLDLLRQRSSVLYNYRRMKSRPVDVNEANVENDIEDNELDAIIARTGLTEIYALSPSHLLSATPSELNDSRFQHLVLPTITSMNHELDWLWTELFCQLKIADLSENEHKTNFRLLIMRSYWCIFMNRSDAADSCFQRALLILKEESQVDSAVIDGMFLRKWKQDLAVCNNNKSLNFEDGEKRGVLDLLDAVEDNADIKELLSVLITEIEVGLTIINNK